MNVIIAPQTATSEYVEQAIDVSAQQESIIAAFEQGVISVSLDTPKMNVDIGQAIIRELIGTIIKFCGIAEVEGDTLILYNNEGGDER